MMNEEKVNLEVGSKAGYDPALNQWINSQAYVPRHLIAILVEGFGSATPERDIKNRTLRAIIELHAVKIVGLNRSFTYDRVANRAFQDDPGVPKMYFAERCGRPIDQFHLDWMRDLAKCQNPEDRSQMEISVLFFEPDPTYTQIVQAYMCTEMCPRHLSGLSPRRDIAQAGEAGKVYVEYHAKTTQGNQIDNFALEVLKTINLSTIDQNEQAEFVNKIAEDVLGRVK